MSMPGFIAQVSLYHRRNSKKRRSDMKTINIAGFTAETALYRSRNPYRSHLSPSRSFEWRHATVVLPGFSGL